MKKEEDYISPVMFRWESFAAAGIREEREKQNGGARWTDEFRSEVRQNIERYAAMENVALRNFNLNDIYKLTPYHYRDELFKGIYFPVWG